MEATNKPRIGLLGLMLELYDKSNPELRPQQEAFTREHLVPRLEAIGDVVFGGIQNTRAGVAEAVDEFIAEDCDLLVTLHLSYSPSLITMPELLRWSGPIVMWNTQRITGVDDGFQRNDVLLNHGMHGVQDLANTLNRVGRPYYIVTAHFEDPAGLAELEDWAAAARTAKLLRKARVGQVGFAFQDMGDFGVDETIFLANVGPHVLRIKLDALAEAQAAAPGDQLREIVAADREAFEVDSALTEDEHIASARAEWALRKVVADMHLNAVSIHYEAMSADPRFDALPFAAASKLLAEGRGFGGEGDVTSASAVYGMAQLCGVASFGEMFTIDFDGESVYMAHYAEANPAMARKGSRPKLCRREGWVGSGGVSTSLAFAFEPGPATMINLTIGEGGAPKLIAFTGAILDFYKPDFDTPHCKFSPGEPIGEFLTEYSYEGGSHHLALAPGSHIGRVAKLADLLDINYSEL